MIISENWSHMLQGFRQERLSGSSKSQKRVSGGFRQDRADWAPPHAHELYPCAGDAPSVAPLRYVARTANLWPMSPGEYPAVGFMGLSEDESPKQIYGVITTRVAAHAVIVDSRTIETSISSVLDSELQILHRP